jgi:hypothetical protein
MISVLAIVIAGVSLVIVTITVYRNLPVEPVIVLKSDHGENGPPPPTQELAIVDSELNLVL